MATSEVYGQALAKCEWAGKHIDKLQSTIREFWELEPCTVRKQRDPASGDVTYQVDRIPDMPANIPFIVGDVLNNLRSALDYVACGLPGVDPKKTKFPIRCDPKDWEVSGVRMVAGASQEAIDALRGIRPYKGGNTLLYVLHDLNNVDKHRLLLTVMLKNTARTVTKGEQLVGDLLHQVVSVTSGFDFPKVPLYAGQELFTVPAAAAEQNMGFLFDIAFGESGAAKGMPVLITLEMIAKAVGKTITTLAPLLE